MIRLALAACVCVAATSAAACRLALVLAIDVSSSVDAREDQLQRQGLATALLAPEVQRAFFASSDPVALHAFEWSGRYDQRALLPDWQLISSPDALRQVATAIAESTRSRTDMPTALGHALGHGSLLLEQVPDCLFHTIDVAADGENNDGFSPRLAYGAFPFEDVTVNALVVNTSDTAEIPIRSYYETQVIRGPGAFVEEANGYEDYARAMTRKLLRELRVQIIGSVHSDTDSPG